MGLSLEDIGALNTLLERVRREEPNGWLPSDCLRPYHALCAQVFTEMVLMRETGSGPRFLLEHRTDNDWDGWHIPGTKHPPRKVAGGPLQIVRTLAAAEFPETIIKTAGTVHGFQWTMIEDGGGDHPWCNPFSHVVLCTTEKPAPTSAKRRYVTLSEAAQLTMVTHHFDFLRVCQHVATTGKVLFHMM